MITDPAVLPLNLYLISAMLVSTLTGIAGLMFGTQVQSRPLQVLGLLCVALTALLFTAL